MFGLEILDVIIGLFFVYLVLSLICTAVNEYIATLTNRRGKELEKGIRQLLKDTGGDTLANRVLQHHLVQAQRPIDRNGKARSPSYLPARTFAMALLDAAGYTPGAKGEVVPPAASSANANANANANAAAPPAQSIEDVIKVLRRDAMGDVVQFLADPSTFSGNLPPDVRARLTEVVAGARTEYQKLHDSVEIWYNNAMDRVSGAYKRYTQVVLLVIAAVVALATNADTIQIWRTLSTNDKLRDAMVTRAVATMPQVAPLVNRDSILNPSSATTDTTKSDTSTPPVGTDTTAAGGDTTPGGAPPPPPMQTDNPATGDTTTGAAPADSGEADGSATGDTTEETTSDDSVKADSPATGETTPVPTQEDSTRVDSLRAATLLADSASSILNRMELKLEWTWEEAARLGLAHRATPADWIEEWKSAAREKRKPEYRTWYWGSADVKQGALLSKLIGLLITTLALTLGAPFWFDTLNKFINIRGSGRAPHEKPISPEARGKRLHEIEPK